MSWTRKQPGLPRQWWCISQLINYLWYSHGIFVCLQYICLYYPGVLGSESGQAFTCFSFLFHNSLNIYNGQLCWLWTNLEEGETFLFCPLYVFMHFFCTFLYGALHPRFGLGSCTIEKCIIIIISILKGVSKPLELAAVPTQQNDPQDLGKRWLTL